MRASLKLALIIILSFSLFGCQSEKTDVHMEIKTVASDSGDCQDVLEEHLKETQVKEPDMALVEKRRAQLAKIFATGAQTVIQGKRPRKVMGLQFVLIHQLALSKQKAKSYLVLKMDREKRVLVEKRISR